MRPARSINTWLGISAPSGVSLSVGISVCDQRTGGNPVGPRWESGKYEEFAADAGGELRQRGDKLGPLCVRRTRARLPRYAAKRPTRALFFAAGRLALLVALELVRKNLV